MRRRCTTPNKGGPWRKLKSDTPQNKASKHGRGTQRKDTTQAKLERTAFKLLNRNNSYHCDSVNSTTFHSARTDLLTASLTAGTRQLRAVSCGLSETLLFRISALIEAHVCGDSKRSWIMLRRRGCAPCAYLHPLLRFVRQHDRSTHRETYSWHPLTQVRCKAESAHRVRRISDLIAGRGGHR